MIPLIFDVLMQFLFFGSNVYFLREESFFRQFFVLFNAPKIDVDLPFPILDHHIERDVQKL